MISQNRRRADHWIWPTMRKPWFLKGAYRNTSFSRWNVITIYKTLISFISPGRMSYEEIAQITELPEGTVKSICFVQGKRWRKIYCLHTKEKIMKTENLSEIEIQQFALDKRIAKRNYWHIALCQKCMVKQQIQLMFSGIKQDPKPSLISISQCWS